MGKILIYTLSEGKGGIEEYVLNISRCARNPEEKYGYMVLGYSTVYEEELKRLGVDFYFVPPKKRIIANIKAYSRLFKRLRSEYDTIYFNTSGLYYPVPYLLAIKNKYRMILHSHSTEGKKIKAIIHKINRSWINRFVSVRLSCSTPSGQWMFGKRWNYEIIPNAIDLARYKFDNSKRENCRAKYGLGNDLVIGTVGRLHWGKNQLFLVDILKELLCRGENAKLIIVGDGDMKEKIKGRAELLSITDKVIFAGQTNRSEYFYSAMDCFLLPSFAEGFPVTLIEAQANGLPCLASDRITQETNISHNIKYLSITDTPQIWVNEILKNRNRYDCLNEMRMMGYDLSGLESLVSHYFTYGKYEVIE